MRMDEEEAALNRAERTQPKRWDETRPAAMETAQVPSRAQPQPTTNHQMAG